MPKKAGNEYDSREKSKPGQRSKKVRSRGIHKTVLAVRCLLHQTGDRIYLRGQERLGMNTQTQLLLTFMQTLTFTPPGALRCRMLLVTSAPGLWQHPRALPTLPGLRGGQGDGGQPSGLASDTLELS